MEKQENAQAVLFVDIVDSTKLYEAVGDKEAQTVVADALTFLTDIVEQHGGHVIKTIGDAVMATFDSADASAQAAIFMQNVFQTNQISDMIQPGQLKIRVGLHYGTVIVDQEDVFGGVVNIASRVASEAKPSQILTTAETRELFSEDQKTTTRFFGKKSLKGLHGEFELYEIIPEHDTANITMVSGSGPFEELNITLNLALTYQNQTIIMNRQHDSFKLGRNDDNDLAVKSPNVSRLHATIQLKSGKYILTDKSINGTYVRDEDGKTVKIQMDQYILNNSGQILLGSVSDEQNAIQFQHVVE